MWGKENNSDGRFGKFTVFLITGFVLLQLVVFVRDAFRYQSERPALSTVIHDTVFVKETVCDVSAFGNKPLPIPSQSKETSPVKTTPDTVRNPVILPVRANDEWKWDMVELNSADSAALDDLPGVGGYYAKQILRYRERLGAFTDVWQLLEIRGMDSARVARMAPRVRIDSSSVQWIDLKTVTEDVLASHPYVGKVAARGIVRLRGTVPDGEFSLESIVDSGILTEEGAARLGRYVRK